MAEILLATESYVARSSQLSDTMLLNGMTEKQPAEAKAQWPLFSCPGIREFKETGAAAGTPTGPCRGWVEFLGQAFGVFGDSLYRVDESGVAVWLGGGIAGTRPVQMEENGTQIIIVNGLKGYIYDGLQPMYAITSPAFYPSNTVAFIDGFFVLTRRGTNQWFISELRDGATYNALQFATAEADSGYITTVVSNLQLLYVFTSSHIELWYNAGTSPFPFQRYSGGVLQFGCISPYGVVVQDGAVWFVGRDRRFYQLSGNKITAVSNPYIERLLDGETDADLELAELFTYTIEGHKLLNLTLRGQDITIVFDTTTGRWHNRDSVNENFDTLGRYRARFCLPMYGRLLVGDAFSGLVGELDWSLFAEYDNPMRSRVRSLNQHKDRRRVFCKRLELDLEFGTGQPTGQAFDPKIRMRRSVDGGKTFGGWQPPRSFGRMGEYGVRARWLRQGQGRQMSWEFEISDPVPWCIIQAHGDLTHGYN